MTDSIGISIPQKMIKKMIPSRLFDCILLFGCTTFLAISSPKVYKIDIAQNYSVPQYFTINENHFKKKIIMIKL
jgi:hypothetical protein